MKTWEAFKAYLVKKGLWADEKESEFKAEFAEFQKEGTPAPAQPIPATISGGAGLPANFAEILAQAVIAATKPVTDQVAGLAADFKRVQDETAAEKANRVKTEAEAKAAAEVQKHVLRGALAPEEVTDYTKQLTDNFDAISKVLSKVPDNPALKQKGQQQQNSGSQQNQQNGGTQQKRVYESSMAKSVPREFMDYVVDNNDN